MDRVNKNFIFVIEDCQDIQQLLHRLFTLEGYTVQVASNGQVALDILSQATELPAMILLDLMMPVMDGFSFREQQRYHPRLSQIPVIVMTADTNAEAQAKKMGATAYIKKPIPMQTLLDTAASFCV